MSFKVVVIDDEPKAIDLIKHYISQLDMLVIKQTFRDPFKAYHYLSTVKVDLVFLDINMPQLSGLELLVNLEYKPSIIFTTAHSEYAMNGFDLDVIDYLLKPISYSRFLKSVQKFMKFDNNQLPADPVYIKSGTTNYKFFWCDIKFLEKSENYVIYHLLDGSRLLNRATLSEIEKLFPSYVLRVHKSFAVCLYNISIIRTNQIKFGNEEIPIGKKFKNSFHLKYNKHKLLTVKG